jgi:hypothetical protein
MSHGIIFWGNSIDGKNVFYIQKKIIRILAGTKRRASYRELFKKLNILPLTSEFLLSLLSFVVDNIQTFQTNSDIHNVSTRYRYNLHVPYTNLSKYQKGTKYVPELNQPNKNLVWTPNIKFHENPFSNFAQINATFPIMHSFHAYHAENT